MAKPKLGTLGNQHWWIYRHHISDLRTGHVIILNCACEQKCAFVNKNMGCGKCLLCQWPSFPSLGSLGQVEYKIQQKCVVCMCSSSLDLPGEKHFGIRDPSFQVNAQ